MENMQGTLKKNYEITETGKAEVLSMTTCPICGAARDNNLESWGFVSGCWNKAPLVCGHGFVFTENMNITDDASLDDWQSSVLIRREFIQELEALGYTSLIAKPPIYRLPCSLTGLDAEVDNCYPPAIIVGVEHADDPMSAGCVDRYLTTDGQLIDCSIDSVDFAQWFELEELEEYE